MKNFFVTFVLEIQVIFIALFQEVFHFSHTPHTSYYLLPSLTSPSNRWLLHWSQDNAIPWYVLIEKEIQYWWILKENDLSFFKDCLHFELFQDLELMDSIKKSLTVVEMTCSHGSKCKFYWPLISGSTIFLLALFYIK